MGNRQKCLFSPALQLLPRKESENFSAENKMFGEEKIPFHFSFSRITEIIATRRLQRRGFEVGQFFFQQTKYSFIQNLFFCVYRSDNYTLIYAFTACGSHFTCFTFLKYTRLMSSALTPFFGHDLHASIHNSWFSPCLF